MAQRLLVVLLGLALLATSVAGADARGRAHHRHHARAHHKHRGHHRAHRHRRPAPAAVPPQRTVLPAPVPVPVATTPAPPSLGHLQATEKEFSLTLSRPVLTAGPASVEAVNAGEDPHNLSIERVDAAEPLATSPLLDPGTRVTQPVSLQPGTYRLFCTLSGHAALGMQATLTVR